MSGREWLAVAAVALLLFGGMPVVRQVARATGASSEMARKLVHVAMGLACACFPWVFHRPLPVWVLAAVATVPLAAIRLSARLRQGIGSALHGIDRPSYGEVLFSPAVAAVFHLAGGDRLLYLVPLLILTLADAAGALAGTRWGRMRYGSGGGFKTVEGSLIFGATAFLCAFLPLVWLGCIGTEQAFWIGLILALLAMMAEGLSDRGFDNLVLPLGCFFVLEKLLQLEIPALAWRSVVLGLLLAVVLAGARWSTLSGGALLAGALLGYGCAVLADWRFALPPLAVFLCHVVTTRRLGLVGKFDHRLDAVISHAIGCLPWVLAVSLRKIPPETGLAGVSFAMGAQLAILDAATRASLPNLAASPVRSALKGFVIASLPGLVWLWPLCENLPIPALAALAGMVVAVMVYRRCLRPSWTAVGSDSATPPWIERAPADADAPPIQSAVAAALCRRTPWDATRLWMIGGVLALAASAPALLLLR